MSLLCFPVDYCLLMGQIRNFLFLCFVSGVFLNPLSRGMAKCLALDLE